MAREKKTSFCSSSNFPYKRRRRKEGEMFTFDKHGRGEEKRFFPLLQSSVRIGFGKPPTTLSPFWIAMCSYFFCLSVKGSAEAQRNWWSPLLLLFCTYKNKPHKSCPNHQLWLWEKRNDEHIHKCCTNTSQKEKKLRPRHDLAQNCERERKKMKTYLFFSRARKVCGKGKEWERNCISASASALFSFFFATTYGDAAAAAAAADSSNDLRPLLFPLGNYWAIGAFLLLFFICTREQMMLDSSSSSFSLGRR